MSLDAEPLETAFPDAVPDTAMASEHVVITPLDSEPVGTADPMLDEIDQQPVLKETLALEPVASAERVTSVDMLRGFALLGILAMNIVSFGWPDMVYGNPMIAGGFTGINKAVWYFNHLFFEMKMMTLFSMLFGAGLVLMGDRAEAKGRSLMGVYYRRVLWLLAIGMVHAYFIWIGDILVMYSQCGLLLYPFRRLSPRTLIVVGLIAMLMMVPIFLGIGAFMDYAERTAAEADAAIAADKTPTDAQKQMKKVWAGMGPEVKPTPAKIQEGFDKGLKIYRGSYRGIVRHRASQLIFMQIFGFLIFGIWGAGGRMLLGMGLMKLGVFSGQRSARFYAALAILGYGIGIPLMIYDAGVSIDHHFDMFFLKFHGGVFYNLYGSVVVALGHVGLWMLIYKSGALTWLTRRLAAVGRMALSNYLTHSIVCTTLFYGYGFGLFGRIDRWGLALIVLTIWIAQLTYSPIWLRHYRFGPAEWVWRSLTHWKLQPMRREPEPLAAPV